MRGKLKKLFAAVLAVLLALSFSGCSELTGLDAQALMSPPKTTADREAIYALMGGGVGDVTLVYPKYGDYRSAIISRDLDGCGTSEVNFPGLMGFVRHFGGRELLCKRRCGRHAAGIF